MGSEQQVQEKLAARFGFLADKMKITRERRLFADVEDRLKLREIIEYLKNQLNFVQLCTITGIDEGEKFCVIYHVAHDDGTVVNLKIWTPRDNPVVETVCDYYEGGTFYEKELIDLLGIVVNGLPAGDRYPLPEDWPAGQYPLRKDWTRDMLKKKES